VSVTYPEQPLLSRRLPRLFRFHSADHARVGCSTFAASPVRRWRQKFGAV